MLVRRIQGSDLGCGSAAGWSDAPGPATAGTADPATHDRLLAQPLSYVWTGSGLLLWMIKESKKARPNTQHRTVCIRDGQTCRDSDTVDNEAVISCCRGTGIKTVAKLLEA
jgi:hypothetical protein